MIKSYNKHDIVRIGGVDHPESLSIGPKGEVYTTGTGCQVYRVDLATNTAEPFAQTENRCLGQAVDADGNLYCADCVAGKVLKITQAGQISTYATGPGGQPFLCTNYPAFDRQGNMYLSDSGDWSGAINGRIYKIKPGGGEAELWYSEPVDTPNAIALDAEEQHLYFVETFGSGIARIAIHPDGSAGAFERVVHMPRHVPDGIAFDSEGRLWIACHRPDAIYVFDLKSRRLELFVEDWMGEALRGPTDVAFAGPNRDIMLAASLDNLCVHRLDNTGLQGLSLNHPKIGWEG
ncbi:MAG: SMP-30/gluconolactonase/LRE family protein [Candidatus Latescibacteria bacterium]|nr:SMP-30/gluconolactonase/LRE family protein [Candidatus Latescibacterota bacterium]MCK5734793.1 SMP-30/gluconolactonase/LRE family protein [Candidatus Latescibacterota bacterium]